MTRKISTFLFIAISFCVSMEAMGQDFQSLREKVENSVKTKRPDWKLVHKGEEDKQAVYNWGSVREGIGITIFYGDSKQEAIQRMEFKNKIISVGPGKKRKGFGDEAYSWESSKGNFAGIRFRKANVYIEVTAPSLELAEELAKDISQKILKK